MLAPPTVAQRVVRHEVLLVRHHGVHAPCAGEELGEERARLRGGITRYHVGARYHVICLHTCMCMAAGS